MWKKLSIRIKIIFSFIVIFIVIGIAGYFFVINYAQDALRESIGNDSVSLAQNAIDSIDRIIYRRLERWQSYVYDNPVLFNDLSDSNNFFSEMDEHKVYIAEKDREWQATSKDGTTQFMRDIINNQRSERLRSVMTFFEEKYGYPVFLEIFITNKYGVNIAETGKTTDYYQADEDWWQLASKNGTYISDIEYDESSNVYSLEIVVRIDGKNGDMAGVLKAVYNIQEITSVIDSLVVEDGGLRDGHEEHNTMHIDLIDKDGKSIYATKTYTFQEDVSKMFFNNFSSKQNVHIDYFIGLDTREENLQEELIAHGHSKGYKDYPGLGWVLAVEHSVDEVFEPVYKLRNTLVLVFVLAILISLLLAIGLSTSITSSIKKLSETAQAISNGAFNERVDIKSQDEIGRLAKSFNSMTGAFVKTKTNIEKQVVERTSDLEKINKSMIGRELKMIELKREIQKLKNKLDNN
jgi:HAMP domain-containing protein